MIAKLDKKYPNNQGETMKTRYIVALSMLTGIAVGGVAIQGLYAQAKPMGYVVTEVTIIDEAAFKEFSSKTQATVDPFGGKRLVRGGKVTALEGEAPKRVIITAFESTEKAQAWRNSAAWKEILPIRAKAVKSREYIVEGAAN
jgi:uncharacterized protein (DUF1330 family)